MIDSLGTESMEKDSDDSDDGDDNVVNNQQQTTS